MKCLQEQLFVRVVGAMDCTAPLSHCSYRAALVVSTKACPLLLTNLICKRTPTRRRTHSGDVFVVQPRIGLKIHSDTDEQTPTAGGFVLSAPVTRGQSRPTEAQVSLVHYIRGSGVG